ncbi:MAG: S24/S26 family peptidase [Acidimicrobiia bacterium]
MTASRLLRLLASLGVFAALAFVLWPKQFGGDAVFAVVQGQSMEPTYHQGDFVYARSGGPVAVGDVAIYRIPEGEPGAGALVVHRVKEILADGRLVFQGDNKAQPDDFTPAPGDVFGEPVLDAGSWPTRLLVLTPVVLAILSGVGVAMALWPEREPSRVPLPGERLELHRRGP